MKVLTAPSPISITGFDDGIGVASAYANAALTGANEFLLNLSALAEGLETLPTVTIEVGVPEKSIYQIDMPDEPDRPDGLDFRPFDPPSEPSLRDVAVPVLPSAPEFTAAKPVLNYPVAPDVLDAQLPSSPDLEAVLLPDAPTVVLPVEPSLLNIDIPAAPVIDIPTFEFVSPSVPDAPNVGEFSFTEPEYVSSLLSAVKAKLLEWVNGATTGLEPDVEQAMFDRSRSREDAAALREQAEIRRNFATGGFPAPAGAMQAAMQDAVRQTSDKISAINREITIQVAELEQKNRQFAMERSVQLEGVLIEQASGIANRALDAAKTTITVALDLYRTIVARYQAELEGFKIQAMAFETRLKAALASLEVYRGELAGAQLVGELNKQSVMIYSERVRAITAVIEQYKAQLSGAEIISGVNRNTVAIFAEEIRAYGTQVDAKAREYDAYASQLKGEAIKVDVFSAEADAYRSEIGGYESLINARTTEKELEFKISQENPMNIYRAKIDAFKGVVGAEADRVRALSQVYDTDIKKYGATIDGEVQQNRSDVEEYRMRGSLLIEEARTTIQSLLANLQRLTSITSVSAEISKAGGSISAQLAASAMSMLNFSQSLSSSTSSSTGNNYSASESRSVSESSSDSTSTTHNHHYDHDDT